MVTELEQSSAEPRSSLFYRQLPAASGESVLGVSFMLGVSDLDAQQIGLVLEFLLKDSDCVGLASQPVLRSSDLCREIGS